MSMHIIYEGKRILTGKPLLVAIISSSDIFLIEIISVFQVFPGIEMSKNSLLTTPSLLNYIKTRLVSVSFLLVFCSLN